MGSIEMSLEAKFGSEGIELMSQVTQINELEQLEGFLRRVVLANNIDELR